FEATDGAGSDGAGNRHVTSARFPDPAKVVNDCAKGLLCKPPFDPALHPKGARHFSHLERAEVDGGAGSSRWGPLGQACQSDRLVPAPNFRTVDCFEGVAILVVG